MRIEINLSTLEPGTFFQYDDNNESILCQLIRRSNGIAYLYGIGRNRVEEFTEEADPGVFVVEQSNIEKDILDNLGKWIAIHSVEKKMKYVVSRVDAGPLSSTEEGHLFELLEAKAGDHSVWTIAIKQFFQDKNSGKDVDSSQLVDGLASQCRDDIFTMTCMLGLDAVIYLLRSSKH